QTETHTLLVTDAQISGRWKLTERAGGGGQSREPIVFDKQMAVGGENERHIETLRSCVEFGLFQAVCGRQILGLRLNKRHGNGLGLGIHLDAKCVINAALGLFPWLSVNDLDGSGGFLAPDKVF